MSNPQSGEVTYLQLPTSDVEASARFYAAVFSWRFDASSPRQFQAAGLHGMLDTERQGGGGGGPLLWLFVSDVDAAVQRAEEFGGRVIQGVTRSDDGPRLHAVVVDPGGNEVGVWQERPPS